MQKKPRAPSERNQTLRKKISDLIQHSEPLSTKAISALVGIPEKEVYDHLEHIQRSLPKNEPLELIITPSECRRCQFIFESRQKLKKPSRCPECKAQSIEDPLFSIQARQ